MKIWHDGTCKCGYPVIEMGSTDKTYDFQNTCTNEKCDNFKWHYVYDYEILDYYNHGEYSTGYKTVRIPGEIQAVTIKGILNMQEDIK